MNTTPSVLFFTRCHAAYEPVIINAAMSARRDNSLNHHFVLVVPEILSFLTLKESVQLAGVSRSIFSKIQDLKAFWERLDFSSNSLPFCLPPLKALLSSQLSKQGKLVRGISFEFSQDFNDDGISYLPPDEIWTSHRTVDDASSPMSESIQAPPDVTISAESPELYSGLLHLNLNGCEGVSDKGLILLSQRSRHLITFQTYWNVRVTDEGVGSIIQSNRNTLSKLNLSGNLVLSRVSVSLLQTMPNGLAHLIYISVSSKRTLLLRTYNELSRIMLFPPNC